MSAIVYEMRLPRSAAQLACSSCGETVEAACRCGVPYLPAAARAAASIAVDPDKSDRAHAAELGIDQSTVTRARNKAGDAAASPATIAPPERRLGRDGKLYTVKRKAARDKENYDSAEKSLFLLECDAAAHAARYDGVIVDAAVIHGCNVVISAWTSLLTKLGEYNGEEN